MAKNVTVRLADERMLELLQWALSSKKVETEKEYLEAIGFGFARLSDVRTGNRHFTLDQITAACSFTGANANWILGLESNIIRTPGINEADAAKNN